MPPVPTTANRAGFLSRREAAELLGVTTKTIDRRIADGSLPATRLGGLTLISFRALHAFLERATDNMPAADDDPLQRALAYITARESVIGPLCPRCVERPQGPNGICQVCDTAAKRETKLRTEHQRSRKLDWWHSEKGRAALERRRQQRLQSAGQEEEAPGAE